MRRGRDLIKLTPEQVILIQSYAGGSIKALAKHLKVSRTTIYHHLRTLRQNAVVEHANKTPPHLIARMSHKHKPKPPVPKPLPKPKTPPPRFARPVVAPRVGPMTGICEICGEPCHKAKDGEIEMCILCNS